MSSPGAPALFLEPPFRDVGVRWFGQRGFGGLLENDESEWIPQYNLQNYWKRRIPPISVGLVEPLIAPRFRKADDFHRLPGHFPYKTNEFELYNRNLLASRFFPEENESGMGILKIWTVSERSKRQYLEGFQVEINKKGQPMPETLSATLERKLKMTPPIKSEDSAHNRHKEPLLELRTSVWSSESSTNLFLRSPTLLQMLQIADEPTKQSPIFHAAVKCFAESHLIQGRMTVVDFGGRMWMFHLDEDLKNARKLGDPEELYQNAIFTDHPMLLAMSGHFHVEIVDSRSSGKGRRLWKTSEFSTRGHKEPLYFQDVAPPPPVIRHVARVPGSANHYLAMTDYQMVLLDDRFVGKSLLEVRHPFSSGGHRMVVVDPIRDGGGEVFPIFLMEQIPVFSGGISMTKIYRHSSGLWSAVDAFHSLGEPHDFNSRIQRGKYQETSRILDEPTRAISLVELPESSLLLRQTDDGAIWWQKLSHSEISEKKLVKEERKSGERIENRLENEEDLRREAWRPVYSDGMSEEVTENQMERRSLVHIEIPAINRKNIEKCARRAQTVQRKAGLLEEEMEKTWKRIEVLELNDEHSTLSKIVLDTWNDAQTKMDSI